MRALALAGRGPLELSKLLAESRSILKMNPSLILITANTEPDWIAHLAPLIRRGIVPTVLLLDPTSYDSSAHLPGADELIRVLAEMGVSVFTFHASMFDRPEMRPGTRGRWIWGRARSARAHAVLAPEDSPWEVV